MQGNPKNPQHSQQLTCRKASPTRRQHGSTHRHHPLAVGVSCTDYHLPYCRTIQHRLEDCSRLRKQGRDDGACFMRQMECGNAPLNPLKCGNAPLETPTAHLRSLALTRGSTAAQRHPATSSKRADYAMHEAGAHSRKSPCAFAPLRSCCAIATQRIVRTS